MRADLACVSVYSNTAGRPDCSDFHSPASQTHTCAIVFFSLSTDIFRHNYKEPRVNPWAAGASRAGPWICAASVIECLPCH